jgi:hypothetical protein
MSEVDNLIANYKSDVPTVTHNKRTVLREMIAIAAGIILTWIIFWAFLTWDNFSEYYGRSTWASFTAVSKGDGSMVERAKAATLFVLQIMSVFLLAYGGVMFWTTKERIYLWQIIIAAVLIVFVILSTALEWLST